MNKDSVKTKEQLLAELYELCKKSKEQEDKLKASNQQLEAQNQQLRANEEALKASEERLDLAMMIKNEGIWDWNLVTNQVDFDQRYYTMAGYDPGDFANNLEEFKKRVHPEEVDCVMSTAEKYLAGQIEQYQFEFRFKRKDGSWMWIQARGQIVERDEKGIPLRFIGTHSDIAERKRAEEELKASENRLKQAEKIAHLGYWELNLKNNVLIWSDEVFRMFDLKPQEFGATYEAFLDNIHPDDREKVNEAYTNSLKTKTNYEIEHRRLLKNGKLKYVLEKCHTEYDDTGKPIRSMGTVLDITERKQAEKEFIKLSSAVTQSPSIIEITDSYGNLEYVNPKFTEITGYSLEEVIGQNPNILQSGEHPAEMYKELWETISSGKTWRGELLNKKKSGELFWTLSSISPIFDEKGKIINYMDTAEDITERKRNEQIQNIIHNISNASITSHSLENFLTLVKDELGKLIETTNFFVALYDEKADRITLPLHQDEKEKFKTFPVGKTLTNYVIKTGKSLLAKKAMIEKLIQSGEVKLVGQPTKVWLGMPLKSENKITGIFTVQSYDNENAYDETDVKMLEIISHQISLSLVRLKAEEDLKKALVKAEEMNRVKSFFFANMSHELRTPFVAIKGYAEFLLETLTDPEDKELAEGIISGADRLTDTLNKILSLTKLEFDKREIELKEMNLSEVINDSFKLYSKTAEKKNLNCIKNIFTERSYNEEELIIKFDEEALRDILNNLLSNAIKYTEKGRIELKTDIEKRNEGEFLVIKVTDTGIGIPKEKQALIWDEFRQVSEGLSRSFEGTGLGLAITKKRVTLLGGKVSVESEEGKGSSFIVELPIRRTGQVEKSTAVKNENDEPTEPVETNSLQISKKILYVEDDKDAQNIVHKTLSNNYTIEIANNVEEALAKVKSQKYDAFLIDINLGEGINGVQLMEMIREMPEYKETPMTAITAFAADSDRKEFLAKGFTHYVSKPFALKELKKLVQEMFG